jgi:hypothetical protein
LTIDTEYWHSDRKTKAWRCLQAFGKEPSGPLLLDRNAIHRALGFAGAAVSALFRVDLVDLISFSDRVVRAYFSARTTRDALVRIDLSRHIFLLGNSQII